MSTATTYLTSLADPWSDSYNYNGTRITLNHIDCLAFYRLLHGLCLQINNDIMAIATTIKVHVQCMF